MRVRSRSSRRHPAAQSVIGARTGTPALLNMQFIGLSASWGLVKGGFDLVRGGGVASDGDGAAAGFPALGGGCIEFWSGEV